MEELQEFLRIKKIKNEPKPNEILIGVVEIYIKRYGL